MNDQEKKMWESAYSVLNHPRMGPYMHGAAMMERTSGVAHFWLVRGPATQSVVQELQQQLGQAYRSRRLTEEPKPQPASKSQSTDRTIAGFLLLALVSVALCAFAGKTI